MWFTDFNITLLLRVYLSEMSSKTHCEGIWCVFVTCHFQSLTFRAAKLTKSVRGPNNKILWDGVFFCPNSHEYVRLVHYKLLLVLRGKDPMSVHAMTMHLENESFRTAGWWCRVLPL